MDSFTSPVVSIMYLIREFSTAIIHGVLTHSLPLRILGLKVDEDQHNVFNQREFSSAIIQGVLTHSLPHRMLGLMVDENQHNVLIRVSFPLQSFMESGLIHIAREYWD